MGRSYRAYLNKRNNKSSLRSGQTNYYSLVEYLLWHNIRTLFLWYVLFLQGNAPSDDKEKEMARLRQINKDFQVKEQEYDNLYEQHTKTQLDLQLKHQALDAFKETITVFEEQMELHRRFHSEAAPHEVPRYVEMNTFTNLVWCLECKFRSFLCFHLFLDMLFMCLVSPLYVTSVNGDWLVKSSFYF